MSDEKIQSTGKSGRQVWLISLLSLLLLFMAWALPRPADLASAQPSAVNQNAGGYVLWASSSPPEKIVERPRP